MARPGIVYEQVAAAADALKAQGQRPTIDAVRMHLGTGSKSTIHRYLRQWEDSRPPVAAAPVEMPTAIHAAIVEEIRRAVTETRAIFEQQLAEIRVTADELAQLNEDLEATNDALTEKLEQEQTDNQQLVGRLDATNREIDQIKKDAAAQVAEIREQAAGQIAEARADALREREAAELARQALARADLRLEAMPRLENDIDILRAEIAQERAGRQQAEQNAAVLAAKFEAAQNIVAREQSRADKLEVKLTDVERAATQTMQELTNARVQAQAQQTALDAAAREVEASKTAVKDARAEAKKAGEEAAELRGKARSGSVGGKPQKTVGGGKV